jgi:hypothetical protein
MCTGDILRGSKPDGQFGDKLTGDDGANAFRAAAWTLSTAAAAKTL